jgi:hypothetical protein
MAVCFIAPIKGHPGNKVKPPAARGRRTQHASLRLTSPWFFVQAGGTETPAPACGLCAPLGGCAHSQELQGARIATQLAGVTNTSQEEEVFSGHSWKSTFKQHLWIVLHFAFLPDVQNKV